jgi:glycogen phosphorylase
MPTYLRDTALEADIRRVSDEKLWALRTTSRRTLVDYARESVGRQMAAGGATADTIARTQARLDPGVLTLGFARRFAAYKRPNLLLHDPERLLRILKHPQRPVQLILAGKAHPADQAGQALIQEWTQFIRRSDPSPPAVFLADYDMLLAEHLVQGIDVWINTPRRPWEASGTSGMKVLVNGGLNLSELDGWWAEAFLADVGWAVGDGREHGDDSAWDAAEADALYKRLEQEVIPEFYARNDHGLPVAWVARIRESMAQLTPAFAASRTVIDYTEQHYLPAAQAYRQRAADQGGIGRAMVEWRKRLEAQWPRLGVRPIKLERNGDQFVIEVEVDLADLDASAVRVEMFANGLDGGAPTRLEMTRIRDLAGGLHGGVYRATVSARRPATDYTARLVPRFAGLSVPLETGQILWQR